MPVGRKPTVGEYILHTLSKTLTGYVQGKMFREKQDKLDEANAKKMSDRDKYVMDALKKDMASPDPNIANPARVKFNTMAGGEVTSMISDPNKPHEVTESQYDDILIEKSKKYFDAELARKKVEEPGFGKTPLVNISMSPFEQSKERALGAAAAKAETTINSVNAIVGDMGDMFAMFDSIPETFKGNILVGGTLGQVGKLTQPQVRSYYDTRQLTLANVAKKLGGEVGVLTDRDIARIESALPDVIDTPEAVELKKKFIYNYMDRRVRAYQKTARLPEVGIGELRGYSDPTFDIETAQPWESGQSQSNIQPQPKSDVQLTPAQQYLQGLRDQGILPSGEQ